ncbi:MAG: DUF4412 domain-containing protein, partial [Desulfobacula sp.]
MMRYLMMVFLIFFTTSAFAADDIAATYKYKDGSTSTVVTRDSQHVRMNVSPTDYMLLQKGTVYTVSKDDDGKWMVMDMSQMKAMTAGGLAGMMAGGAAPKAVAEKDYTAKYEKTGKKEQVAGYSGEVYNVKVMEGGKLVRQDEMVLCSHDDLKKVNDAWSAIASKMGIRMGEKTAGSLEKVLKEAKVAGYGGMLRYGDEMKLESLKKQSLDDSTYQIPPDAEIENLGA